MMLWCDQFTVYLIAYHDVCDLGPAVHVVVLLLVGEHRQDKVPRLALALPHQEAARLALVSEQLLRIAPGKMPVEPPGQKEGIRVAHTEKRPRNVLGFLKNF